MKTLKEIETTLKPIWHAIKFTITNLILIVTVGNLLPLKGFSQDSISLINPSFEWGFNAGNASHYWTNTVSPFGYVPFGWKPSENNIGINDNTGPSWDNGGSVDGTYIGFIQGKNSLAGNISQTNSGFQIGQIYWIQFFANAKDTNSITGAGSTPEVAVVETASTSGSTALITNLNIPTSGGPIGTGNPFTFVNVPFTAAATNGVLTILKSSHVATSKSHLFLDGFSIIRRTANDIVVANPSFEASGTTNSSSPVLGYIPYVAGWTKVGSGALAINQSGGQFADNGTIPDGGSVIALQGQVGIRQTLHGLTPGNGYQLTIYLNGRAYDAPNIGHSATALIAVDGNTGFSGTVNPVGAAGTYSNAYNLVTINFLAASSNATVEIDNQDIGGGASTLLVDNVRVLPLTPSIPLVLAQPADATRYVSGTVTFTAAIFGFPTPQLQWKFNDGISTTSIAGATNQTLTLSNLQLTNAGSYALYATNSIGATNSSAAALSLVPAPDSAYAHAVLANNPIGYWRFSDGGGTNAYDYVGNHTAVDANYMNNGNGSSGTPAWLLAGPQSPAFPGFETTNTAPFLDGLSQGYASSVGLFNNRSNFTLMGWFNLDPSQYPISNDPWAHAGADERASLFGQEFAAELGFYHGTNLYFFATGISGTIFVTNGFAPGQWEFVAVVSDTISNTTTVYLNGAVAGTASACPGTVNSYLFSIGKDVAYYPAGGYDNALFPGSLDEVAAFDHPLAAAQIQALYNTGLGISSVNQSQTNITVTAASGQITLAWPQDHTGWVLEAQTNALNAGLGTNWARIPSSATTNRVTVPVDPSNPTVYYRLVYP